MQDLTNVQRFLDAGFAKPLVNKDVLVDRKNMKIVSQEAADDRSAEWTTAVIADANDSGTWKFYFKDEVPEDVSRRLLSDLGS